MEPLILPAKHGWAGFTGTRYDLSEKQYKGLWDLLRMVEPDEVQHGDCVGADSQFHDMAGALSIRTIIRPPTDPTHRAWCQVTDRCYMYPEKPYLARNHDIVNNTNYLIACPRSTKETLRSGTWATVRYAGRNGKTTYLVYPNGLLDRREPLG